MSYQIIPNIIFIFSVLGILLIILRHLPEAASVKEKESEHLKATQKLLEKGLPAQTISVVKVTFIASVKKIWNFLLEVKDLKPHAAAGYKIKKILGASLSLLQKQGQPTTLREIKSEEYYLERIKQEPKQLAHYDALGRFYMDRENTSDAIDIYQYLVNHQPFNPDYQSRLAYCFYLTKNFTYAAEHYQKSLDIDSVHPNRYYNLGLSLQSAGKKSDAIKALKKALEMEPKNEKYLQTLEKLAK